MPFGLQRLGHVGNGTGLITCCNGGDNRLREPHEREALLHVLAQRPGFYVPSLHGKTPPAVADQALRALLPALAPNLGYN